MSMTIIERDLKARLDAADALAQRCQREQRDFTAEEAHEIEQLVADAKAAKAERARHDARVAADAELLKTLQELSVPMSVEESRGLGGPEFAADAWFASDTKSTTAAAVAAMRTNGGGLKALNPGGSVSFSTRLPGAAIPRPFNAVWQLVRHQTVPTGEVSYLRQTVRTSNAAPVAIGALKPTSIFSVEKITATLRTIAHLSEAIPRQHFEDDASLSDFIAVEMMSGVLTEVDSQIVSGDGTGENLDGILSVSGVQAQAFATSPLVTIRRAITKLEVLNVRPTAIALAPSDWEAIELAAGSDGQYLFAGLPADAGARQLFGIPVATATAVPVGTAIVANWDGALLVDRGNGSLTWTEFHDDDWSHNLVRWRAEIRVALEVLQPQLFVVADLTA